MRISDWSSDVCSSDLSVRPETREHSHDPAFVEALSQATGIFMTGGNQLKLSGAIIGTPFAEATHDAHRRGAVIAGTSAGARIQSSHMVAFGRPEGRRVGKACLGTCEYRMSAANQKKN